MTDNTPPAVQETKEGLREDGPEAAQKRPQPSAQPLRPALTMSIRADGNVTKDSDNLSTKSGASKGMSDICPYLFACDYDCDCVHSSEDWAWPAALLCSSISVNVQTIESSLTLCP